MIRGYAITSYVPRSTYVVRGTDRDSKNWYAFTTSVHVRCVVRWMPHTALCTAASPHSCDMNFKYSASLRTEFLLSSNHEGILDRLD